RSTKSTNCCRGSRSMPLDFDNAAHAYTLNGVRVPSVTEVLSPLEDFSRIPHDVLEAARVFGQHVHVAMALLVRDELDWAALDPSLVPYIVGGKRFLEESGITVVASEQRVCSKKLQVAGTFDLFGVWRDAECLIDFKATAAIPKSVGPQSAGYDLLRRETFGGKKAKRYCVQLRDNDYRFVPLTDPRDYAIFISCLNVFKWRNSNAA
ncbi:MAG: hypothetical protein WEE89_07210, partial [Gemmatimonadota bacterium]